MRVIVKNLPSYLTQDAFRAHFAAKHNVTDAKLIFTSDGRSRQFGFVGYKSEQDAQSAIKYFHNTYIHTARISVEIAKPLGDADSTHRGKKVDVPVKEVAKKFQSVDDVIAADPKLAEFLGVMQPQTKKNTWGNDDTSVPVIVRDSSAKTNDGSDDEYQDLTTDGKKQVPPTPPKEIEQPEETKEQKEETELSKQVDIITDTGRLFLRNLPYTIQSEDIKSLFEKYGPVSDIHVPLAQETKQPKGFAYVTFLIPEDAVRAYSELDGSDFQGRLLHIIPALDKPSSSEAPNNNTKEKKYKDQRKEELKKESQQSYTWNSLFMSQDAVADAMANQLGLEKSDLLQSESGGEAVKLALAETYIVQETKRYLLESGVNLAFTTSNTNVTERSDTVLLVKGIPFKTTERDLMDIFARFGDVVRVILPPTRTMAIVEYGAAGECQAAFKKLAFRNFLGRPLLLEKAPVGILVPLVKKAETIGSEVKDDKEEDDCVQTATLYIKNLNFETSNDGLASIFAKSSGFRSAKVSMKKSKTGKFLSMGFGFVEFQTVKDAKSALISHQNVMLDGHALQLKFSDKSSISNTNPNSKRNTATTGKPKSSKLLVRNVPFEATKKELHDLFSTYGQIKRLRIPKKFDNSNHRGFCFIDFLTKQEAANAYDNLGSTHLYGRHLVLEWAEEDDGGVDVLREKTKRQFEVSSGKGETKRAKVTFGDEDEDELDQG